MLDRQIEWTQSLAAQLFSPRLAVVVTSIDSAGRANAAPFSFFMPLSYIPPRVCFSVSQAKHHMRATAFHYAKAQSPEKMLRLKQYAGETLEMPKDTLANIMATGEFGINVLPVDNLEQVIIAAYRYPHGVDEIEVSGLTPYPSALIKPPLIKEAKAAAECKMLMHVGVGSGLEKTTLVIGEVVAWHIDSEIMEDGEIKPERMHTLIQFAKATFGVCNDFRYRERVAYPEVIPMPKPAR
ncbi:MAG: flavin reductase family protein [Chloroflexi bacterium]|nr:flavin reductase family protein [Chloroflexota bacterium]